MRALFGNIKAVFQPAPIVQWFKKNTQWLIALALLVLVCFLVMLPRLRSTQFGLLDDGVTIKWARALSNDFIRSFTLMKDTGRFLPAYWFSQILIYQWAGISSLRWFYFNLLLLVLDTLAIFGIMRYRGASLLQSTLAGLFFTLSAPIIETFYTLSKPDLIMITWLIWGIFLFMISRVNRNVWIKRFLICASALALGMSIGTKEPAVVLVGIVLGWFITALLFRTSPGDLFDRSASKTLLFSALATLIVYIILRFYFLPVNPLAGTYSSNYRLSLESISAQLLRWLGRFLRDFFFLLPLLCVLLNRKVRSRVNPRLLLDSLVWMGWWMAIFLPWNALESFHTLPFAIGMAMAGGLCLGAALPVFLKDGSPPDRIYLSLVFVVFLFFVQITFVNNISTARVQLFYDRMNNRMVKNLSRNPPNSMIYFNTPYSEYVVETGMHLDYFRDRGDLIVDYFRYQRPEDSQPIHYFVVNPVMENAPLPSVRNSLYENGVLTWDQCFKASINPLQIPIYDGVEKLRWTDFGANRLLGSLGLQDMFSYTVEGRPFLDSKVMTYGWQVYEIEINPAKIAHPGSYDGAGGWVLQTIQAEKRLSNFGSPGDLPLTGDLNGDGHTDLSLYQPTEHRLLVDLDLDGAANFVVDMPTLQEGDVPLPGDWDDDGIDTLGYFRPSDSSWHFTNDISFQKEETPLLISTAYGIIPLAGDWDGDGDDTFGFYFPATGDVYLLDSMDRSASFAWVYRGEAYSVPVAADWYGFGRDTLAIVKDGQAMIRPNNAHCDFPNPIAPIDFGSAGDFPLGGRW